LQALKFCYPFQMRKTVLILYLFFVCTILWAENPNDKRYLLTTNLNTFGFSTIDIIDPYLSPTNYSGIGLNYTHENRRFLKPENTTFSMQNKLGFSSGLMLNPTGNSALTYLGTNYGWGVNYHIRLEKGIRILAGGLWDIDFGFKYMARNVNNPVNVDLSTNLNLAGLLQYDIPTHRRTMRLEMTLQTPIIGCMYVPLGGASYYDMFELGSFTNAIHASNLFNKRGLVQTYAISIPFNQVVWRFGLRLNNLIYKANNMVFTKNEYSLLIGTTFDAIHFGGQKKPAPQNFISTNE
jgi:hypothetical protein